jgi:hypothetical protein
MVNEKLIRAYEFIKGYYSSMLDNLKNSPGNDHQIEVLEKIISVANNSKDGFVFHKNMTDENLYFLLTKSQSQDTFANLMGVAEEAKEDYYASHYKYVLGRLTHLINYDEMEKANADILKSQEFWLGKDNITKQNFADLLFTIHDYQSAPKDSKEQEDAKKKAHLNYENILTTDKNLIWDALVKTHRFRARIPYDDAKLTRLRNTFFGEILREGGGN